MGYMTPILFLNDGYSSIKENPEEVTNNVCKAMDDFNGKEQFYGVGNHCNPMSALRPEHADVPRLMLAHQNSLVELGFASELGKRLDLIELRKRNLKIAKQLIKQEERAIKEMQEKAEEKKQA